MADLDPRPSPRDHTHRTRAGRVWAALGIAATLLVCVAAPTSAQVSPDGSRGTSTAARYRLGARPAHTRIAAHVPDRLRHLIRSSAALPDAVDLTGDTLSPGDQGQVGSCVAWSIGYSLLGWYSNYQHHAGAPFAPMYLYSQINGGVDDGAFTRDAYDVLVSQGIAERSVYVQGDYDWQTQPTAAERANAANHKITSYEYLFSGDNQGSAAQTAIETALAANQPVELVIPVYDAFYNLSPTNSLLRLSDVDTSTLAGYHAIAAFGYDGSGVKIENSWGSGWGVSGYATLGWDFVDRYVNEASVISGFAPVAAPTVTGIDPSIWPAQGSSDDEVTISGTGLGTVDPTDPSAVQLINLADPTVTVNVPVVQVSTSSVTVTVPAAPTYPSTDPQAGQPILGDYRIQVTTPSGTSPANPPADQISYVTTFPVTVDPGTLLLSTGGSLVTLHGTGGFGNTQDEFTAEGLSASVNGTEVPTTWVDDTTLQITAPAGVPGTSPSIAALHHGAPGVAATGATYAANLSSASRHSGRGLTQITVRGRGMARATGWVLLRSNGSAAARLRVYSSQRALARSAGGVWIASDTRAVIKLPAAPGRRLATYTIAFTPNASRYPGATYLATSAALWRYTRVR